MKGNTMKLLVYSPIIEALFSLLLLLSGDVELNPGPDPMETLLKYSAKLSKAISMSVGSVANALFAKDLITPETKEHVVTVVGVPNADKADRVVTDVMGQLEASLDERKYLVEVSNVLIQQGAAMKEIGNVMLKELEAEGVTVAAGLSPSVVKDTALKGRVLHISDLYYVFDTLNEVGFSGSEWKTLGLALGLHHNTLEAIEANHPGDEQGCLKECLLKWLKRADDVDYRGGPTMASLCDALEEIGDRAIADHIKSPFGMKSYKEIVTTNKANPILKEELDKANEEISKLKEELDMRKKTAEEEKMHPPEEDLNQPLEDHPPGLLPLQKFDRQKQMIILIYTVFLSFIIYVSYGQSSFIAHLPGVEVTRSTNVVVPGGILSTLYLEEYGLVIVSPPDAIPAGLFSIINIRLSVTGPYIYPDSDNHTMVPASPVYWLSSSKKFLKPLQLGIRHFASEKAVIKVYTADDSPRNMSYVFEEVANVTVSRNYVYFSVDHFSGDSVMSNEPTFCGSLHCDWSSFNRYHLDCNYVISQYGLQQHNCTDPIKFEENSMKLELDIRSNPSQNWKAFGNIPLACYKEDLQKINLCYMKFSLQWQYWYLPPATENLYFPLKGALSPEKILVTTQSIHFWEHYNKIFIVSVIIITISLVLIIACCFYEGNEKEIKTVLIAFSDIIVILFITYCFPDYMKETIGNLLYLLQFVLFVLVLCLVHHFFPELTSNPLAAIWTAFSNIFKKNN